MLLFDLHLPAQVEKKQCGNFLFLFALRAIRFLSRVTRAALPAILSSAPFAVDQFPVDVGNNVNTFNNKIQI